MKDVSHSDLLELIQAVISKEDDKELKATYDSLEEKYLEDFLNHEKKELKRLLRELVKKPLEKKTDKSNKDEKYNASLDLLSKLAENELAIEIIVDIVHRKLEENNN